MIGDSYGDPHTYQRRALHWFISVSCSLFLFCRYLLALRAWLGCSFIFCGVALFCFISLVMLDFCFLFCQDVLCWLYAVFFVYTCLCGQVWLYFLFDINGMIMFSRKKESMLTPYLSHPLGNSNINSVGIPKIIFRKLDS